MHLFLMNIMKFPELVKIGERTIGIGLIRREINSLGKRAIYGTGAYHALKMINNHSGNYVNLPEVYTNYYATHLDNFFQGDNIPYLDNLVTKDSINLYITLLNRHFDRELTVEILINNFKFQKIDSLCNLYQIHSEHFLNANTADSPIKISEQKFKIDFDGRLVIPPHSLNILEVPLSKLNPSSLQDIRDFKFQILDKIINNTLIFQISGLESNNASIEIYDIHGRNFNLNEIDLRNGINYLDLNFNTGLYFIIIKDKHKTLFDKFYIIK